MTHTAHIGRIGALMLAVLTTGAPAFAQIDLSGEWSVVLWGYAGAVNR